MTTTTRVPCFFAMAVEGRMPSAAAIAIGPRAQTRGRETGRALGTPLSGALCRLLETAAGVSRWLAVVVVGRCGTPAGV